MSPFRCSTCGRESRTTRTPTGCQTWDRCDFVFIEAESAETTTQPAPAADPAPASEPERSVRPAVPRLLLAFRGHEWTTERATVLGRNGDVAVEIFREFREVSRKHCELQPRESEWWLANLSEHSPTRLDGYLLAVGTSRRLTAGSHELLLGDAMLLTLTLAIAEATEATAPDPLADFRRQRALRNQAARDNSGTQSGPVSLHGAKE